jgi:DNA-binding SARP family transcriptional activator
MEFQILGALEVHDKRGPVPVAGDKQRLLLALLLAQRGRAVSRDALTGALWPERVPGDPAHALDVQVSRLRKAIGAPRLVTRDGGYLLDLSEAVVDVDRFDALVARARDRPPPEAAALLRDALALWRGPAFGEFAHDETLPASAQAAEDRRSAAMEALFDAELALGRHEAIVPALQKLTAEQPLRERPREQLMLALYRCGRQADALRVYDDLRRRMSDELGVVPGESVRRLHEAIVLQDRCLDTAVKAPVRAPAPRRAADRRARLIVGALGLAALVLVGVVVLASRSADPPAPTAQRLTRVPVGPDRLAFVGLRRGTLLASIPIGRELVDGNGALAQGRDADWLSMGDGSLLRIDSRRHRIANSTSLGFEPSAIAVGLGSVWVVARDRPVLLRIEPGYGLIERRYRLPAADVRHPDVVTGVAVAAGSV